MAPLPSYENAAFNPQIRRSDWRRGSAPTCGPGAQVWGEKGQCLETGGAAPVPVENFISLFFYIILIKKITVVLFLVVLFRPCPPIRGPAGKHCPHLPSSPARPSSHCASPALRAPGPARPHTDLRCPIQAGSNRWDGAPLPCLGTLAVPTESPPPVRAERPHHTLSRRAAATALHRRLVLPAHAF